MKKILRAIIGAHWIFAFVALIFGLSLSFITPPLWGADEAVHFFRAWQISNGEISQSKVTINGQSSDAGSVPSSFVRLNALKNKDNADSVPGTGKQVDSRKEYFNISKTPVKNDTRAANPFPKTIYSPVVYFAPAMGIYISHFFNPTAITMLMSARIATLILYVLLASLALYVLRKSAVKWLVFIIALLPMSLYQASVVSPDSLLLGLSLILFSILYATMYENHQINKKEIGLVVLTACLITLIKAPYLPLIFLLLLLKLPRSISPRKKLFIKIGIPILCTLVAVASVMSVKGVITSTLPLPNINIFSQLHGIFTNPFHYLYTLANSIVVLDWVPQIIGLFGASFIYMPGIVIQILLVSLFMTTFVDTKENTSDIDEADIHSAMIYIGFSLIAALAIITTLYLTWTPVSAKLVQGIQGRYFLPIIVFFLFGLRKLTGSRLLISKRSALLGYPMLMTLSLLISLAWYYRILH